jgi:hypothetical protein
MDTVKFHGHIILVQRAEALTPVSHHARAIAEAVLVRFALEDLIHTR